MKLNNYRKTYLLGGNAERDGVEGCICAALLMDI